MIRTHELYRKLEREACRVGKICSSIRSEMHVRMDYELQIDANLLRLRLCVNASLEMRELASRAGEMVVTSYPEIFEGVDCRGSQLGICPEPKGRSCGKYPTRKHVRQ